MAIRSLSASVSELASTFAGELLQPQDPGYDLARRVHNGLIDRRPALIARCGGTADIVDAVKLAQEHGLEVAVRGGGHNVAGRCTTDSGLMIDLAAYEFREALPQIYRRDQKPAKFNFSRIAGQVIEKSSRIRTNLVIAGE